MKNFFEKLRVEDWVVVWVSIPLLLLAALIPADLPSVPATLVGEVAWYNIGLLFAIVLVVLYVGCLLLRRPLKGLLPSLVVVFVVSLLAQVVAKIPAVSYYGFESVFFSVLFGLVIRNVWRVPAWMKPAIQGEFFIKIGVVCLGATILFSDVMKSGVFGLVQACLVVAVVWFFAFRFSRRMKVDERSAMILASGLSICGVSASITAARVVGGDDRKLSYIVSLVLIVVVPMIYLMPWLANLILRHDGASCGRQTRQRRLVRRRRVARDAVADVRGALRYVPRKLLGERLAADQLHGGRRVAAREIPALPAQLHLRRLCVPRRRQPQCGVADALRNFLIELP